MIARERFQSLRVFQDEARSDPRLSVYASQMAMLHDRIAVECPEAVAWAAAYGNFLDLRKLRSTARSPARQLQVLVVTKEQNAFDAYLLLGEKVFGPVLLEFGKLPSYTVWTRGELKAALKADHEVLRRLRQGGITIYGSPPPSLAVA